MTNRHEKGRHRCGTSLRPLTGEQREVVARRYDQGTKSFGFCPCCQMIVGQ